MVRAEPFMSMTWTRKASVVLSPEGNYVMGVTYFGADAANLATFRLAEIDGGSCLGDPFFLRQGSKAFKFAPFLVC